MLMLGYISLWNKENVFREKFNLFRVKLVSFNWSMEINFGNIFILEFSLVFKFVV